MEQWTERVKYRLQHMWQYAVTLIKWMSVGALIGGVGGMGEDVFMVWGTDVIGEPAFHQKYLKGLQEKLEKYAKLVKKDMTDEDVENVYVNALIPMKGLRYEVEELRRKYLEETLMQ